MKSYRVAFGVVLLALCVGATVSAQLPPPPPPPPGCVDCAPAPGGTNTVTITMVDTTVKNKATLKGSFTVAAAGVTLTAVKVFGFPTAAGGAVVSGDATTISNDNKTWSGAVVEPLLAGHYTFRAEGTFSDGGVYSVFSANQVIGAGGDLIWPKLNWNPADSSPTSPAAGTIAATGTWASNGLFGANLVTFNAGANGFIKSYLTGGGVAPTTMGGVVTIVAGGTWTASNQTGLTPLQTYYPLVLVLGSDMKTYCAPVVTKTVQ